MHQCTKIGLISKNYFHADSTIRRDRNHIRNLQKELSRLKCKRRLQIHGQVTENSSTTHIRYIFSQADKYVTDVLQEDSSKIDLWKIHLRHVLKVAESGGKNLHVRFDPLLLQWSISLLAKTSHTVYD